MKHFGTLVFFLTVGYLVWSVAAGNPNERMDRACMPSLWSVKVIGSIGSALNMGWAPTALIAGQNVDYRCKLTIWNFFYGDQWKKDHPGQILPGTTEATGGNPAYE